MAIYLIDYENVHNGGLAGIMTLSECDTVIIFMGNMINNMPIKTVLAMLNSSAQVKIKKMKKTADNYLDFQLATCLGGLITGGDDKEFYIISNDRDFESVIDYWRYNKASVKIERRSAIAPNTALAPADSAAAPNAPAAPANLANPAKLDNATKKLIRGLVKDEKLSPGNYTGIYNLFLNENEKQAFHTGLVRLFEQKRGSQLYGLLKDAFDQYKA